MLEANQPGFAIFQVKNRFLSHFVLAFLMSSYEKHHVHIVIYPLYGKIIANQNNLLVCFLKRDISLYLGLRVILFVYCPVH